MQQATVIPPMVTPEFLPPSTPLPPPIRAGQVFLRSHRVKAVIDNQVATTTVEQEFVNDGNGPAEGEYLFPLPVGAAVSNLTMIIDGVAIQAQLLSAQQAAQIYTETVRRLRDPALLQYVGRSAIQAKVFPIPAHSSRKLQITYSNVVTAENGLIQYQYPLKADYVSNLPTQQVSVSVEVNSKDPISNIYSPDAAVGIFRSDDKHFKAGMEVSNYKATQDFNLFYGLTTGDISANLLTYRASADEDGYFMLMLTPPFKSTKVLPKDVIIVLDQSGSMMGKKWDQARSAVRYVLEHLNPDDRFNIVSFSTGWRIYAKSLQKVDQAADAAKWVQGLNAEGGTDIDGALNQAAQFIDATRTTNVIFLTDGQPTEGETDINRILAKVKERAKPNVRLFVFGVGDDVNTFLLDTLSTDNRGQSVYVRPEESIEAKVSGLYNKITSPVLADLKLELGDFIADDVFPAAPLPDLFAGTQLIITGRYRKEGTVTFTLSGKQNDDLVVIKYSDLKFPGNAGGEAFVAKLWATRKIGVLLNTIRLKGETKELVDSIVALSRRYGIITPYTSFLIQEEDIHRQAGEPTAVAFNGNQPVAPLPVTGGGSGRTDESGQPPAATAPAMMVMPTATAAMKAQSGSSAVDIAADANEKKDADKPADNKSPGQTRTIGSRTFVISQSGTWVDTAYDAAKMKPTPITFLSDDYFKLLEKYPELKDIFALGDKLIVVIDKTAYEIKP
jgi:Ca-activated chloride channel family protein